MFRSQTEVRQSVWDLRRLVQEQFDLSSALIERARQLPATQIFTLILKPTTGVQIAEIVEESFLRINHEALTNVIKHSGATAVSIQLEFEPQRVILKISDNGRGFVPQNAPGQRKAILGCLAY